MSWPQGLDRVNQLRVSHVHNRYDEPVAPLAVKAERCRWRDVVQLPLKQALRAMKPRLDGSFAQAQLLSSLGCIEPIDFAQHEHATIAVWQRRKGGFEERTQLDDVRLPFWIWSGRCNVRDVLLVAGCAGFVAASAPSAQRLVDNDPCEPG